MTIVLMGMELKDIPIKPQELQFDKSGKATKYTDSKGKEVKKIQVHASEYKWVFDDGSEYSGKAYKNINGTPVKEFKKTTLIDKYDLIDKREIKNFINNEHTYLIVNDGFKAKMKEYDLQGQAVAFKFVIRGFKIYKAVIAYDLELDRVLMRCFRGDLRKSNLDEATEKEISTPTDDVKEVSLDDLEV